jgi:hypothetical protein
MQYFGDNIRYAKRARRNLLIVTRLIPVCYFNYSNNKHSVTHRSGVSHCTYYYCKKIFI